MRTRSVLTRMLIWAWCILAAALLALFLVSAQEAQEEVVREATHRAERELDTVKWLLVNHGPFAARQDFDAWIKELGKRLEIRVTFVAEGKVLADSMVPLDRLDSLQDHSTRPEIQHADVNAISTSRRHSETLDREMLYAATQLPPVSGLPRGVLRLAVPFSDLQERLSSMLTRALWTMGLALAVSGILLLMGIRNVGRSIGAFTDMAREMGNGDFSHRIREIPGREFKPLAEAVNAMARRIERHVGTIEEQGGRLRAMFQGMSEGVLVLDERGRIESFNRALEAMHPQVAEAMDRTPLEAGLPLEVQDACDRRRHRSDPGSAPVPSADRGEQVRVCVDESQHLDVSVVPFTGHNGDRKLILVFRDVTAEVAHERALRDFVANASHQLRTPLTSIKGYAETLLDAPPENPEAATKFLRTIQRNADHMDGVLTSMLKLARSEQAARSVDGPAVVDARQVLDSALMDLTPRAAEAGVRIAADLPEGALLVRAEAEGLLHVFHNLLANAVAYGSDGGEIHIQADRGHGEIRFSLRDRGPGIPTGLEDKVFERFFRGDPNAIDGRGGAGLGLAICRQIVENYGGRIWVERPADGIGAVFSFTLAQA